MRYVTTRVPRVYLGIRIPPALKQRLEAEARGAGASLTAAVESMLMWALSKADASRARAVERKSGRGAT